ETLLQLHHARALLGLGLEQAGESGGETRDLGLDLRHLGAGVALLLAARGEPGIELVARLFGATPLRLPFPFFTREPQQSVAARLGAPRGLLAARLDGAHPA